MSAVIQNFNRPRMLLGPFEVVPQVGRRNGTPIPNQWVLPGGETVSTDKAVAIAHRNGWKIRILK